MIYRIISLMIALNIMLAVLIGQAGADPAIPRKYMFFSSRMLCNGIFHVKGTKCEGGTQTIEVYSTVCFPSLDMYERKSDYCYFHGCPRMIRENLNTGEVVIIDKGNSEILLTCTFIDECVPAGKYRYGFESKVTCPGNYYVEVDVDSIPNPCTRTKPAPQPYEGTPQWHESSDNWYECDEGGCSLLYGHSSVIALQLAGVALGMLLLALRRRRDLMRGAGRQGSSQS